MERELKELNDAWKAVEARRYDDLFASRGMIRLGKALIAYHVAARPELAENTDGTQWKEVRDDSLDRDRVVR